MLFGVSCFCGVLLYNYQPRSVERMVVEMLCRQDIRDEVVDYICNSGGCVVDYVVDAVVDCLVVMCERGGVGFYRYCFETVVFMNRVVE